MRDPYLPRTGWRINTLRAVMAACIAASVALAWAAPNRTSTLLGLAVAIFGACALTHAEVRFRAVRRHARDHMWSWIPKLQAQGLDPGDALAVVEVSTRRTYAQLDVIDDWLRTHEPPEDPAAEYPPDMPQVVRDYLRDLRILLTQTRREP
jgi:hypothetical protein